MKRLLTAALALSLAASAAGGALAQHRPHPEWRQGGRIAPSDWRRGQRVDYRSHHLRRPPRGYEWRQVDGNYVLAAAATGLIAGLIAGSH
jgi:Ni/Co efflux regulator RcnB